MSGKHTPGPWWVRGDMPGEHKSASWPVVSAFVEGTRRTTVARVGSGNASTRKGIPHYDWANARLIAAAPDLLAACHAALASFEQAHAHDRKSRCACELVTDAIAKATGGAK